MMMGRSMKDVTIIFLLLLISCCYGGESSHVVCEESEKEALLSFKQELKDPSKRLSSWDAETNCCTWVGVVCHNLTAHVIQLQLPNPYQTSSQYEAYKMSKLGGKISRSLVDLKHLNHLDLSGNDFVGIPIPSFIGSLPNLQYLNLSYAGFEGAIPHELGNLTSLRFLSLSGPLNVKSLEWLAGFSSLEHLDMSYVNLNSAPNWLQVINMLPFLVELHLSSCALSRISPLLDVNFTSLAVLDISGNEFYSSIPGWIFSLSSLVSLDLGFNNFEGPLPNWLFSLNGLLSLDLSDNGFEGQIPEGLLNLTNLRHLDMSWNNFNPTIPDWLYSLSHLESLRLSGNQFQGTISSAVENLTSAVTLDLSYNQLEGRVSKLLEGLCNLRELVLSGNKFGGQVSEMFQSLSACISDTLESLQLDESKFYGHLTDQLAQFKSLRVLSLRGNSISGPIPASLGSLSYLNMLDLRRNQLNGTLPESLGQLSNLEYLDISNNLLEGVVSEVHFANLTSLKNLYASNNRLVLKVNPDWIPPFQCHSMELRSWNLGDKFPSWLRTQKNFHQLDLSSTGISGNISDWFWNLFSELLYLNLSHNQIHGRIPDINCHVSVCMIYLNSNQFSGPLPRFSSNVTELDLSNNSFSGDLSHFLCDSKDKPNKMQILHLGKNFLFGNIPNCWMNWRWLNVLILSDNNLTGSLPNSMGRLDRLQSLHLRNNNLSGEIPVSLRNCTELVTLDLSENQFVGSIPRWIGEHLSNLMVFVCRSNKLHGEIPREFCYLTSLQIVDLSNNNLSGIIPKCVNNFTAMTVRLGNYGKGGISYSSFNDDNFWENAFVVTKGRESEYNTILTLVTNIELSNNNINGEIPEELTDLLELRSLNLSGNRLEGSIPKKIGDMKQLESLDLSRNQLSSEIPPSMAGLTFLSYLNLSSNNLTGKIPLSTQLQSFNASSFVGNHLCGPPLLQNCSLNGVRSDGQDEGDEGGEARMYWFYLTAAFGFVLGFWGVFGPILFHQRLRRAYFLFLDHVWKRFWR